MTEKLVEMIMLEGGKLSGNVVEQVKVCGLMSANGYAYPPDVLKAAASMYENVDVYANHKDQRLVEDKIGFLSGIHFVDGSGLWASKLTLNEAHPIFAQTIWWVENAPNKVGLSHSIGGTMSKDKKLVEKITAVESVDLVAKPATNKGLREAIQEAIKEGVITDTMKARDAKIRLDRLVGTAYDLATSTLWTSALNEAEKQTRLSAIFSDLLTELKPSMTKESKDMAIEWDKLTVEELVKNAPKLVEALQKEAADKASKHEKQVQEALQKVSVAARTAIFEAQVRAAADEKALTDLVEDRIAVSKPAIVESKGTPAPIIEKKDDVLDESKISEETKKRLGTL